MEIPIISSIVEIPAVFSPGGSPSNVKMAAINAKATPTLFDHDVKTMGPSHLGDAL